MYAGAEGAEPEFDVGAEPEFEVGAVPEFEVGETGVAAPAAPLDDVPVEVA